MHDDFDEADEIIAMFDLDRTDAEALTMALTCLGAWAERRGVNMDEAYAKATDALRDTA